MKEAAKYVLAKHQTVPRDVRHFKDYPNDAGFADIPETRTPIELKVTGTIPSYVHGVLYRTGPGSFTVPTKSGEIFKIQHWYNNPWATELNPRFDGFALQHRFEITVDGRVFYRSRRTCDKYIKSIQDTGKLAISFGQRDLCKSFFRKFFTMLKGMEEMTNDPELRNVSVTFTRDFPVDPKPVDQSHRDKISSLYINTDVNVLRSLDPVTLDPIESTRYTEFIPEAVGITTASHAAVDPHTGELFNFVLKFGRIPIYTLFKLIPPTAAKSTDYKILAAINDAPAAYVHSVCLTNKYFIFCIWQADFAYNGATIPFHKNLVQAFKAWDPKRRTLWYVIDRDRGGIVRKYESDPFFAFHYINSYDDGDDVIIDLPTFTSHRIVQEFYVEALKSTSATKHPDPPPLVTRVRLQNITSSKSTGTAHLTKTTTYLELPTISRQFLLRHNRYTYGVSSRGLSSLWDCVIKVDLEALFTGPSDPEKAVKRYARPKCTPSEPIFVARPGATEEDDGVVLTVELDGVKGTSALVVLDAMSFQEIGRAQVEGKGFVIPHGFHGVWYSS